MTKPIPPIAEQRDHRYERHGIAVSDPWAWLRDPNYPKVEDADVLDYLRSENDYFEAVMAPHQPLIDTLFAEMRARIKEDDATVPQRDGDWWYWSDFETGGEYRRWWRKPVAGGDAHSQTRRHGIRLRPARCQRVRRWARW